MATAPIAIDGVGNEEQARGRDGQDGREKRLVGFHQVRKH